jgi:hypothetical protein
MTSCEETLDGIVSEVLELVSEEHVREMIDAHLEEVAETFDVRGKCPSSVSQLEFVTAVADFISLLYGKGLSCPIQLSRDQACAEAVFILERTFQGNCADGLAGALMDARTHGDAGLAAVLSHVLGVIVSTQKDRHVKAVMTTRIRFLPWETRQSLAVFLLERGGAELEHLRQCAPWQLAGLCPEMIMNYVKSIRTWKDFLASRPVRRPDVSARKDS